MKGHYGTIYPGGSYTNQITYYIGAYVPTGSYVITAFADYYNNVFEYNAEGNNYGTKYITITQALSNLVPFGVTYSVTTDTIGNTLQLSFNVQDVGTGPATNTPWGDRVGISYLPSLYYDYTTFLGRFVQNYVLLPNGGYYTRSLTTKVPNSIFGNVYLFVQVDYTNRVYESNKQDNIYTIGPFAMPIVLPDLSVSSFSVDSSSPPLYAGTTVVFDWTVTNVGPEPLKVFGGTRSIWALPPPALTGSSSQMSPWPPPCSQQRDITPGPLLSNCLQTTSEVGTFPSMPTTTGPSTRTAGSAITWQYSCSTFCSRQQPTSESVL